ncbi:MAG: insulinase family protein [Alteromonadaceae bacterium]|nr:insulinase family protein [Alteromonadaceae bacterium]
MKTIYKILSAVLIVLLSSVSNAKSQFSMPEYSKTTLDNGLTLYLMQQSEVPMIDVNVVIGSGAIFDGKVAGLAQMTSDNLMFGTRSLDKKSLESALEFVGAQFYTDASLDYSELSASFAKKDQDEMLAILAEVLRSPRFDEEEFNKYKNRYLGTLKRQKESPNSVIRNYFMQMIFPEHPYRAVVGGDESSVEAADIKSLKTFYGAHYQPANIAIVVAGDFESKKMSNKLTTLFGDWKAEQPLPKRPSFKEVAAFDKPRVLLVNKDDARESTFLIGGAGVPRSNPDFVALNVLNTILGGRFTSWLNDELRVNSGLTYGARSRFLNYKEAGIFYISTFTANDTTEAAIDLALKTYSRLWEQGVDAETLKSAKAYVKGQFPPRYETSSELASLLGRMHIYGFDESFINEFEQNIDAIDEAQTKTLIKKYFPQDNLQFTVIGKAEEIRDVLKKYGEVTEIEIKTPGYAL